jgi:hypothetical protein
MAIKIKSNLVEVQKAGLASAITVQACAEAAYNALFVTFCRKYLLDMIQIIVRNEQL